MPTVNTREKKKRIIESYNNQIWDTITFSRVAADKGPYHALINQLNREIEDDKNPVSKRSVSGKSTKESGPPSFSE